MARVNKNHIRGKRLPLPAGVAARYAMQLRRLADEMTATTQREITALLNHPDVQAHFMGAAMDISPASQARILTNKLKERFEQLFATNAKPLAENMVDDANRQSGIEVTNSLRELGEGLTINARSVITGPMEEFMKATIANNVSLIKSIPSEFFRDVQQAVLSSIADGRGLEDLGKFFEDKQGVESRRAKNIAIDQTHKAYNGLNKGRMEAAGVGSFEWVHSGGGLHPREHHLNRWPDGLNGGVFSFAKLPVIDEGTGERGIPGQAINCRCTMVPVIKMDAEQ